MSLMSTMVVTLKRSVKSISVYPRCCNLGYGLMVVRKMAQKQLNLIIAVKNGTAVKMTGKLTLHTLTADTARKKFMKNVCVA